jgi:predicted dehydrogenase
VLSLPDPNTFGGPVRIKRGREEWEDVPFASRGDRDVRGIGLHDMVESIVAGTPHRASGELGAHVVEVACSILRAAEEGRAVEIQSSVEQPPALPVEAIT